MLPPSSGLSFLKGPNEPPLWDLTLSQLLEERALADPKRDCIVFPEGQQRYTYEELNQRSKKVARGLLSCGLRPGDHVGILAGNRAEYVELLFATSHIGVPLVILNNTYTAAELQSALKAATCKAFFTASSIGPLSNELRLDMVATKLGSNDLPDLQQVVIFGSGAKDERGTFLAYEEMITNGDSISPQLLQGMTAAVKPDDVCNLQFTSGTTGNPKAALLTHSNLVNNGRYIGDRMVLTPKDIICCPPPLFHCFGLVLGLLACITHGSTTVFPSETFNPSSALKAVAKERCTGLHGVPSMFSAELEILHKDAFVGNMRTGIAAGAPVPKQLMEDLRQKMNLTELTITYGMTETSPASFMSFTDDPIEKRLSTVGRILPHTWAKVIDGQGNILPIGSRGELCVAGPQLQKGYYRNPQKTAEVMLRDKDGILWMHTGDEAQFDSEGYCRITGRIKDIIIRGGENIFPLEIEERLVQHASISQASVVGIPDKRYGEVVGAFLLQKSTEKRPADATLRDFVKTTLGHHKVPVYIFWLEPGESFPQTGSGKIKKHVLRDQGADIVKRGGSKL